MIKFELKRKKEKKKKREKEKKRNREKEKKRKIQTYGNVLNFRWAMIKLIIVQTKLLIKD